MTDPAPRDFDATRRRYEGTGPSFKLGGETFVCLPRLPVGEQLSLMTDAHKGIGDIGRFIRATLINAAEVERFDAVVNSKTDLIDDDCIVDLHGWLLTQYSARPTSPPSSSSNGRGNGGTSSTPESVPATS